MYKIMGANYNLVLPGTVYGIEPHSSSSVPSFLLEI